MIDKESDFEQFCRLFPNRLLARDLFNLVEDARIDYLTREEYPGIRGDMDSMAWEMIQRRPSIRGMLPKQAAVELLLQLSVVGRTNEEIPEGLREVVLKAHEIVRGVQNPQATVEDSARATAEIYFLIDEKVKFEYQDWMFQQQGLGGARLKSREPQRGGEQEYESIERLPYRGEMSQELVDKVVGSVKKMAQQLRQELEKKGLQVSQKDLKAVLKRARRVGAIDLDRFKERIETIEPEESEEEDFLENLILPLKEKKAEDLGEKVFLYDEWDFQIEDYKPRWCKLREVEVDGSSEEFVTRTLANYSGLVSLIRRQFQMLKPEGMKKVKRQEDGEELDINALVDHIVEKKAGLAPSDKVYIRRDKRERNVATAFLIDMSGSTSARVTEDKRVIDVEKEALVLMVEALEAIGDEYAIYGFSSVKRDNVNFYVIKEFGKGYDDRTKQRIGDIEPHHNTRIGAAIRHTTRKLEQQEARIKLAILLSDGQPFDQDEYRMEKYAREDTKVALREARRRGIHPFCVTVDREAKDYLEHMFGEVNYIIIDDIKTLPEKLPMIYRRLTT